MRSCNSWAQSGRRFISGCFSILPIVSTAAPTRLEFTKRYDDICTEWLGGLVIVKHRSKIRDRLGPHLDQLVALGFLASYAIAEAKTRPGFVLTFRPGALFFQDYDRFYRHPIRTQPGLDFGDERRDTSEPLKLAYLFVEKRTGQPAASNTFIPTKDKETAKGLLAELPFDEMPAFIDYALAEARRTNFDVQTLGGIKHYLAGYMAFRSRQTCNQGKGGRLEGPATGGRRKARLRCL